MDTFDLKKWEGFSSAGGLSNDNTWIDQISIDSRRIHSPQALFVALPGQRYDGHHFVYQAEQMGAKYALVSYDWQPTSSLNRIQLLRVINPLKAFQEIAKTYRLQLPTKIIGITGSFGKTMVKDLLYQLLAQEKRVVASPESFNSQIGVPLSLLRIKKEHEIAIIEAAMSQKEEMAILADLIQPDYTLLTPIGKKHLVTLEDISTIAKEVMQLILATYETGWTLLPKDPLLEQFLGDLNHFYYFWNSPSADLPHAALVQESYSLPTRYQVIFPDRSIFQGEILTGYAYFINLINLAVKAAWLMGIPSSSIQKVLNDYQPEPMRTEIWKTHTGATFINDTYCSDPLSIDSALQHFDYGVVGQKKRFVFGGMRDQSVQQQANYQRIGKSLSKANLDELILFGNQPFEPLINEFKESNTTISLYPSIQETFQSLRSYTHSQDLILIKGQTKIPFDSLIEAFHDSLNNNQCVINLAAIKTNLAILRKKLPKTTRIMVIVKALAYGTDATHIAKFLASCDVDILGVSYVDEAVILKQAGVQQSIFSINAAIYEVNKVVKWDLEVGVSDKGFIQALAKEAYKQNKCIKVHLHINTGMGRFGCRSEEALELAQVIKSLSSLKLEGVMTHFACADDPNEDTFTLNQVQVFDEVINYLKAHGIVVNWHHAANSSGTIRFQFSQYNMVRVGLAIYGLYVSEAAKEALDLRLALSLTSRIVGISHCKKGETISYGRKYTVKKDEQKIAVLPIGYFDGLHRHYSGKAYVLIRGCRAPMVGNICMDYMMVDVTDIPNVTVGDKVLIFGEDEFGQYLSPEDLATSGDSIIHELITCLGPRIQRIFVYEEARQIR